MADAYLRARALGPGLSPPPDVVIEERDRIDPLAAETKRQAREREHVQAICGLRCPARGVTQIPGWICVGQRVLRTLLGVVVLDGASALGKRKRQNTGAEAIN